MDILTRSHVGPDGRLKLDVSTDLRDTDVAIRLSVEPVGARIVGERDDWPQGFIEETYGSLADDRLVRPAQGEYERREAV